MSTRAIIEIAELGFPWATIDPFLFCVYHDDAYPAGNDQLGPAASLTGRNLGQDFEGKDGWRMYHGLSVPGFPAHPHRGFETVTIVRRGLIDHSDSLGATARFGGGDVQWLTAGRGIVHSEMFPLVSREHDNPLELFQIWLNLPARDKMVEPHFTMFWSEDIPGTVSVDAQGGTTEIVCIAGRYTPSTPEPSFTPERSMAPLAPPPNSWAAREESDLAIWTIKMSPDARWRLPAARGVGSRRTLYLFKGEHILIDGKQVRGPARIELQAGVEVELANGPLVAELLILQGRPLDEPVAQYGPFVMNTREQIQQAFADYQQTQFGGWPFTTQAPVHAREVGRFARHADGVVQERP
jgi:quercetin 2,3-dioxygenase